MKKFLLVLCTCTLVLAQNFVNDSKTEYENAIKLYNQKDFSYALKRFEKLSKADAQNPEFHFYVGLCHLELKEYNEALMAFDRVLMLDPLHVRVRLEIARVYFETGSYFLANEEINRVLRSNIPQNVRKNVLRFKENVEKKMNRSFFSGGLSIGFGYDSNANNDIGNTSFLVPSFNVTVPGDAEKSDTSLSSSLYLNHIYDFGEKDNWMLDNTFVAYSKLNRQITANNIALFSITSKPTYVTKDYKIGLPLTLDHIYLAGEFYSRVFYMGSELNYVLDKNSMLSGALKYKITSYNTNKDLNSRGYIAEVKYKRALYEENPFLLTLSSTYENSSKVNGDRTDVDFSSLTYKVEVSKEVFPKLMGSLSYAYLDKDFDKTDVSFLTKREDNQDIYALNFMYKLSEDTSLNSGVSYIDQDSNHAPFEYDKTLFYVSFFKSF